MERNGRKGALVIKADGSAKGCMPENGKTFGLKEAQNIVGGYIETVSWTDKGKNYILIVNADGKNMGMEYNASATIIAKAFKAIMPNDYIVGDAILCPSEMLP